MKSTYVCQRCGCAAQWWRESIWKHATGGRGRRPCRLPPLVMERDAYEQWLEQAAVEAVDAIRHRLTPLRKLVNEKHIVITPQRRQVMKILLDAKGPLTAADIVRLTQLRSSTVGQVLQRFEESGWISADTVRRQGLVRRIALVEDVRPQITMLFAQ